MIILQQDQQDAVGANAADPQQMKLLDEPVDSDPVNEEKVDLSSDEDLMAAIGSADLFSDEAEADEKKIAKPKFEIYKPSTLELKEDQARASAAAKLRIKEERKRAY